VTGQDVDDGTGLSVAVVGSGPSGCYTAQFLRKALPSAEIVVVDAMPVPYGLVRYGVAPDHQGTKKVTSQFDRLFSRDGVHFLGNVRVGEDVALDDLRHAFDGVVLATGLYHDLALPVGIDPGATVVPAGALLRTLNGHPDRLELTGRSGKGLGREVVVVGNGNVALDVVRLLVKSEPGLVGSDVDDAALAALRPRPVTRVTVVGRSAADQAKFDMVCLRELVTLDQVTVVVDDDEVAGDGPVPELLRESAARASAAAPGPVVVEFRFGQRPTRVSTRDDATVLHVLAADGNEAALVADSLVTAIGFAHDVPKWAGDATASGVWRVGWLRRGPRGTIPDNRREAKDVSDAVVAALTSTERQGRRPGLAHLQIMLDDRAVVDFDGWLRIDQAERALAGPSRTRRKVTDRAVMLALATARAGPGPTPAAELSPVV
jgi:ferredoxin--NADP+ reductase